MGLKDRFGTKSTETTTETTGADVLPNAESTERELRRFRRQHQWDPFLDTDKLDNIDDALASGNAEKEAAIDESLIQEDSPYPEVRTSVSGLRQTPKWTTQIILKEMKRDDMIAPWPTC